MSTAQIVDRERWLSGLPEATRRPWWQRMLRSPLFWLTLVLLPAYFFALWGQYDMVHPDTPLENGEVAPGLNNESLRLGAYWAMWTLFAWTAVFLWLDRFRPQRPLVWLLTILWGACASTWFSIHVNSWAGLMMNTEGAAPDTGTRAAIFAAPFVEELSKATVLFLLVILFRAKIVSRLSIVTLAGLSAVGFAFVENIIYYARVYVYAMNTITVKQPEQEVMELVMLRGLYTSFAHPMFTMMTALGIAIALAARSKLVRVIAPLAGFCLAAGGHMLFNGYVSTRSAADAKIGWYYALAFVAVLALILLVTVAAQSQLIKRRLLDFRRHGWLSERDPIVFSSPFKRIKLHLAGIFRGWKTCRRTATFMRRITELAYIRESMTRGTVGEGGNSRAHDLLHQLEVLRPDALTDTQGLRIFPPRKRKAAPDLPPPVAPGPAGLGGNWPAR